MSSSTLTKFLTTPSKVAKALDWRKDSWSLLVVHFGRDKIDLAAAIHPSFGEPIQKLNPVGMKFETIENTRRSLRPVVLEKLENIVSEHNVCGFVVHWPLQKEGRCGARCGLVLHALDSLVESKSIITSGRPFCVWDSKNVAPPVEDEWGRDPAYGIPTNKTLHLASVEQYFPRNSNIDVADVWDDFSKTHWPDLYAEGNESDDYCYSDERMPLPAS